MMRIAQRLDRELQQLCAATVSAIAGVHHDNVATDSV